jgi:thioredoxin-related protein
MRKDLIIAGVVATLLVAASVAILSRGNGFEPVENDTTKNPAPGDGPPDLKDQDASVDPGKPTYYYFWSETCYWCDVFEDETLANQTVIDALDANFTYVAVNIDREDELRRKYGVSPTPTSLFAYPDGTEIGRVYGHKAPEDFLQVLDLVMQFYDENPSPESVGS